MSDLTLVHWESRFETGDESVDFDHQVLFALVNELHCSVLEGCARERLFEMVIDFARYASQHFVAEESLMESVAYPDIEQHRQAHRDLCAEITRLGAGEDLNAVELCAFAYDWLTGHIRLLDLPMVEYVQAIRRASAQRHPHRDDRTAQVG